jgi:hypothetical protein
MFDQKRYEAEVALFKKKGFLPGLWKFVDLNGARPFLAAAVLVWTWRFVWACLVWLALFAWECLCWLWPWIWAGLVWCWNASLDRLASCWHWLTS